jgi:hypothetical protein
MRRLIKPILILEYTTEEPVILQLFNGNVVIRTNNEGSFQGPVKITGFTAFGIAF